MPLTLQKYIFREMGRIFVMTALGLTAVLSTCGGLYNLTNLDSFEAGQMIYLLALVVPICMAMALPLAAVFSATVTYGRLSADNEFTAIRSGGINIAVLLWPAVVISLFAGAVTFVLFNFVIPELMNKKEQIQRAAVRTVMAEVLRNGGSLAFQNQRIYAQDIQEVPSSNQAAESTTDDALWMKDVAFIEYDDENIVRFGTGDSAAVKFAFAGEQPRLEADLVGIRIFDLEHNRVPDQDRLRIGPFEFTRPFRYRPKFLSLQELLEFRRTPELKFDRVARELQETRRRVLTAILFRSLTQALAVPNAPSWKMTTTTGSVMLTGQVHSDIVGVDGTATPQQLTLRNVVVTERVNIGEWTEYESALGWAQLELSEDQQPRIMIKLQGPVTIRNQSGTELHPATRLWQVGPWPVPPDILQEAQSPRYADAMLWKRNVDLGLGDWINEQAHKLHQTRHYFIREMYSELNVRSLFSISVLVMTLLGAMLGIIWRGGQIMVAFAISCVPAVLILAGMFAGKTIAKSEELLWAGLLCNWAGFVLVIILDTLMLKRWLPK
ncbi:MAG: hypothetical protein HJJLKODD_02633 [Phycisphaerae bacterium]|nr:hypothetical protein [Phycisphaerae bacterium]